MDETISMQNAENAGQFDKFIGNRDSDVTMNGWGGESCKCKYSFVIAT